MYVLCQQYVIRDIWREELLHGANESVSGRITLTPEKLIIYFRNY